MVSVAALAEVSGTWIGKIQTDVSKFPEKYRAQVQAGLGKSKVSMTFKPNHTFTSVGSGPDGVSHVSAGTWTQKGNIVILVTKTFDGKPRAGDPPRNIVVGKGGKTLVMTMLTKSNSKEGTVVPPVNIVFSKKS